VTSRAGRPDTDADRQLRGVLNQRQLASFVMIAGAGSGKTTSLIKAIADLIEVRGSDLRRRGQKIVCITYTEVAVNEILGDVGGTTAIHVSTIHSFLWTIVQPFQSDIRAWVESRIGEKIAEAQDRLAKPGTRPNTREKLALDIARYETQRVALSHVTRFAYGTGSDYQNGILGHDDVLKIGPALIGLRPLLRTLLANRYPFIFIDESQDTNPTFIDALRLIADTIPNEFCLGFFGDPMQKIYATGAGPIVLGNGWTQITKPENFRCPATVLRVINRIRSEDDGLEQVGGRTVERDGVIQQEQGTARLFILPADDRRSERLQEVRQWLAAENADPQWIGDDKEADVRVLVLVHRMAARRLGFASIYAALNDNGSSSLKDGLLDGTAWVLRPFMSYVLPLVSHLRSGENFDVMAILRAKCPLLQQERLVGQNASELLERLRTDVARLSTMLGDGTTIREVMALIRDRELAILDGRFDRFLNGGGS
jgi:DNA helicase-2/ATP-dependent DNA helicase PcrA